MLFTWLNARKERAETQRRMAEWLEEAKAERARAEEQRLIKVAQKRMEDGYYIAGYRDTTGEIINA